MTAPSPILSFSIYACAFIVGAVLMGFEMLGSRYLNPYFGGGIGTWAGLISTVLGALTLLGTFSPIAVSLLTHAADQAGRVAGMVYGVSTIGNVVGTLLTTFALIPTIGSRAITYYFALVLALCAGVLFLNPVKRAP